VFNSDFIKRIPQPLVTLLKYCRTLQFKDEPDYNFVRSLFAPESESVSVSNSVSIIIKKPEKDEEEKLSFRKFTTPNDKSFTPNSSFTDAHNIKSFSFLKDNSHNN
jgi:hypothetical protein